MIRSIARPRPAAPGFVWVYAALLVAWGNAVAILLEPAATLPGGSPAYVLAGAALVALSLGAARAARLCPAELGLRGGVVRPAILGAVAGAATGLAAVAVLRFLAPGIVGGPIDYAPLAAVPALALAWHVAVVMPLSIAIPQEVAFRGVLLGALMRDHGRRASLAVSAAAFALWHGALLLDTIGKTTLGATPSWTAVAIAGALVVLTAGGAIVAWLRLATGHIATTVAAHWAFNAVVLLGLWAR